MQDRYYNKSLAFRAPKVRKTLWQHFVEFMQMAGASLLFIGVLILIVRLIVGDK